MTLTWKNGLVLTLFVIVASAIGCAIAFGTFGKKAQSPLHSHIHEVLQRDLGLSPEQTKELQALEEDFLKREANLKAANAAAMIKLANALEEDGTYSARVQQAVKEIHETQTALHQATIEHILETEAVLSAEQFAKFLHLVGEALRSQSVTPSH